MKIDLAEITGADRPWVRERLTEAFGSPLVVSGGVLYAADDLPGWIARAEGERAGLLAYDVRGRSMEILALIATQRGRGVAETLVEAARVRAVELGCERLWLVTTNDNAPAQRFYSRLGLELVEIRKEALKEARRLKPEIPQHGVGGVAIEDEWLYELRLDRDAGRAPVPGAAPTALDLSEPWRDAGVIEHSRLLLESFRRALGRDILQRSGDIRADARALFEAPFVVVSHTNDADPILNYGNRVAMDLWKMDWPTLRRTPSRLTAEPVARAERERMLARAAAQGYVDDYRGVRIASDGRRFFIHEAIVWNLLDAAGDRAGQAATFSHWRFLEA